MGIGFEDVDVECCAGDTDKKLRTNNLVRVQDIASVLLSNDPRAEDLRANELRVNDPRKTYLRANDLVRFPTRVVFPFVVRFPSLAFSRTTAMPTRGFIPNSAPC